MSNGPIDPRWPRLLSLTVHEFRTPMTVVSGYIRMLLKDRAGPVTEEQRRLLEEAEKSCARLSGLLSEVSELSALEAGTATFNRAPVELDRLLRDAVAALPPLPDRDLAVTIESRSGGASILADASRLKMAFASVIGALRRELVTSDRLLVRETSRASGSGSESVITIAEPARADALADAADEKLTIFDEWRGGCGLSLAIARRVIAAHNGTIRSPAEDGKAAAIVKLPHAAGSN